MDYKLPIELEGIRELIPHRHPFLLVDRVVDYIDGERIKVQKAISISDPVLQGHFPQNPVYPGVLMIEGMAQSAAILGKLWTQSDKSKVLLTNIEDARFKKIIKPGDVITYDVKMLKSKANFIWFYGEALCDGELACKSNFSALMA